MAIRSTDHGLRGSVLGPLSFGAIARAISVRRHRVGMLITAHDPYLSAGGIAAAGAQGCHLTGCSQRGLPGDPGSAQTANAPHVRRGATRRMKPTSILINTARADRR